ncbi:MAG: hypothetical protein U1E28_12975 [Beijerinckiaceae bacterium]
MSRTVSLVLVACAALLALAAGVGSFLLFRRPAAGPADYVETRIGDLRLVYQAGYARFPGGRAGGRFDSLQLAATFPDFRPAGGATTALDASQGGQGKPPALLFLSIGSQERKVDPADLTSLLYARFLEPEVAETDEGLLKRAFQDGSPYEGEDLYFSPPEGRAFAARCARPTVPPDGLPETCIAVIREGGLDVDLRFTTAQLPQWEKLAEGARALVKSMIAR